MTRFHFHLVRSGGVLRDEQGTDCPDIGFAIAEARAGIREMAAEAIWLGQRLDAEAMLVADAAGNVLATIPIGDAFPTDGGTTRH